MMARLSTVVCLLALAIFQAVYSSEAEGYKSGGYEAEGYKAGGYEAEGYKAGGHEADGYKDGSYETEVYEVPAVHKSGGSYEENAVEYKDEGRKESDYDVDFARQMYRGMYPGKCGNDGLYYNNEYSFMFCSNGNAYEQNCAPGSRNSGYERYSHGDTYYFHDFCDVNLVDEGYNLDQGYPASYQAGYPAGYQVPQVPHSLPSRRPGYVTPPARPVQYGGVHPRQLYRGMFPGDCGNDGLYYHTEYSFIFCSNGHAFEQHCAPGSRNSGYQNYSLGGGYYFHDFCDVNLVDDGYNVPHGYNTKPVTKDTYSK